MHNSKKDGPGKILYIVPEKKERFRTIPNQIILTIPGVKPDEWEIIGHGQGKRINYKQPLKKEHFDQIKFICISYNDTDQKKEFPFAHAIGTRIKEKTQTFLILEQYRKEITQ